MEALPDSKVEAANRFLECLAGKACDALMQAFPDVPEDDEPVTEEDLRDIEEGKKAVAEGRLKSWEQVNRELDL